MASNTAWARSIASTTVKHFGLTENATMRKHKLLLLLDEMGLMEFNCGGEGFDYEIEFRLHPLQGNTGENRRVFARQNLYQTAEGEYRGASVTDVITVADLLKNQGDEAKIKIGQKMNSRLETSLRQQLARLVFIDGNAAGNEMLWHGIESFLAATQTINIATNAARSANAADKVFYPSDTYNNLSTQLGALAGSYLSTSGSWPAGVCDSEYDYNSPIIVNYESTAFGGATATWKDQCVEALRFAILHTKRNDNSVDLVLLDRTLQEGLMNRQDAKERALISDSQRLRKFGFTDVIGFDGGVEVSWEYAVPALCGYGLTTSKMGLKCMDEKFLVPDEGMPFFNEDNQEYRYAMNTHSNLLWHPRNVFKLRPLSLS